MSRSKISNHQARLLLLDLYALSEPPRRRLSRDGLAELIDRLGYVQVDSINTVERAHHMILFARNETYRRKDLERLLHKERRLFENWTHDAAIIPSPFFPYWQPRFAQEYERLRARWREWHGATFEDVLHSVRDRVTSEGPLLARDFKEARTGKSGGWWQWHPAKTALEYLWRTGDLAVCHREGFQKAYDLVDRVIPEVHRSEQIDRAGLIDWACRSAFERMGFATPADLAGFWGSITTAEATQWCNQRLGVEITEVEIEGGKGTKPRSALMLATMLDRLDYLPEPPKRVRILSPFDPLIRDRKRTQHVFGFDYRIEVFVPEAKRKFGYYVFPILEGSRLVGRIDMKRVESQINVIGLWWEKGVRRSQGRMAALEADIARLGKFVGSEQIAFADGFQKTA